MDINKKNIETEIINIGNKINPSDKDQDLVNALFNGTPGSSHDLLVKEFNNQEEQYNSEDRFDIVREYMNNLNFDDSISKYD